MLWRRLNIRVEGEGEGQRGRWGVRRGGERESEDVNGLLHDMALRISKSTDTRDGSCRRALCSQIFRRGF